MRRTSTHLCLTLTLVTAMTTSHAAEPAPTPEAAWKTWREQRAKRLLKEDGWLSLVGLHWLTEGENQVEGLPGRFVLTSAGVRLVAAAADGWTLDGAPVTDRVLTTDAKGKADRLRQGSRQLQVIERSGKVALRVWDAASPVRTGFTGIPVFPYSPRLRVEGTFEAFATPKEVETPSVVNLPQKELVPGRVHFTLDGKQYSLEPTREPGQDELFFVFRDLTSRTETYGAGRFLTAEGPKDGKVVLDFNRAYNPPCAFTPHATCPLPRRENVLAVRLEAGEQRYGEH